MKIALLGYGRMGQAIEKIAIDRGHTIVAKIDKDNPDEPMRQMSQSILAFPWLPMRTLPVQSTKKSL